MATTVVAAGLASSIALHLLLDHRSDYVGHFAAGFGGTLGLLTLVLASASRTMAVRRQDRVVVIVALIGIAIGAVLEATVFRIARFDPIDFFNQSLGAVIAALAVSASRVPIPLATPTVGVGLALGAAFLLAGFFLAFA